ncbi:MAG: helix-hairpin-helix domain-containing protein [Bacteroidales bacterium]|nr:helix-hairpin-helix domain-containing protein [Bacteroidales bacterium]
MLKHQYDSLQALEKMPYNQDAYSNHVKSRLFVFDPNTLDSIGWISLGLSANQARALLKYRDAGGVFHQAEDLKNVYVISESFYSLVKDYVNINASSAQEKIEVYHSPELPETKIELNSAGSQDLLSIKSIGFVFSKRIVKYRDLLGGFYHISQLSEVYGLSKDNQRAIAEAVEIDTNLISKRSIDTLDYKSLIAHPYLNNTSANTILAYKKFSPGGFSLADLLKQKAISQELYNKLKHYFE